MQTLIDILIDTGCIFWSIILCLVVAPVVFLVLLAVDAVSRLFYPEKEAILETANHSY